MKEPPKGWPRISPSIFYSDAGAAIDWLCAAFGFEVRMRVDGEGGRVEHSELTFGGGLIIVSSLKNDAPKNQKLYVATARRGVQHPSPVHLCRRR